MQVVDIAVEQVDQLDRLDRAKCLLQLYFIRRRHCLPELTLQETEYLGHRFELPVGVGELETQLLAGLGSGLKESGILCPGLAAAHCGLQHAKHRELLLQRHIGLRGCAAQR